MLLLLFNASRTLAYRFDLGELVSCRHRRGEMPNRKYKEQEKVLKKKTVWFQTLISQPVLTKE